MTTKDNKECLPGRTFPEYFTELAANYSRSTGDSTYKVIASFLAQSDSKSPLLDKTSIINDNACGPGVVTAAVIAHLNGEPARIEATDAVPAMIDAVKARIDGMCWKNVNVKLEDSHKLSFPDDTFTTTISNINITTYTDALQCLKEMHRTLKPDGTIIVSIWKRFGIADLIHTAQQSIRADAELMNVPHAEFMQEGYLADSVQRSGFKDVQTRMVSILCEGEEVEGLRSFMLGDFTKKVRAPWSEEERARWPDAVDGTIREEVLQNGGIRFDAWVVTGRK